MKFNLYVNYGPIKMTQTIYYINKYNEGLSAFHITLRMKLKKDFIRVILYSIRNPISICTNYCSEDRNWISTLYKSQS